MAIDLDKIKAKLTNPSQSNNRKNYQWKPQPGKQQVRIVPYMHQPDNPFIELFFHYGTQHLFEDYKPKLLHHQIQLTQLILQLQCDHY